MAKQRKSKKNPEACVSLSYQFAIIIDLSVCDTTEKSFNVHWHAIHPAKAQLLYICDVLAYR